MRTQRESLWVGDRDVAAARATIDDAWHAVRRKATVFGLWMLLCTGLGSFYLHWSEPVFIATAQMVLQPRRVTQDGPEKLRAYRQFALDAEQVDTELQVVRSERLLRRVFDALNLADTPDVTRGNDGFGSMLFGVLHTLGSGVIRVDPHAAAFNTFMGRVRSRRVGLSYVIEVAYRSQDSQLAARVVNAIASAYLRNRVDTAVADAEVGMAYLQARTTQLLAQASDASDAMAKGEVPVGDLPDADVRLLGAAAEPQGKSYPKVAPLLMLAAAMGLISGLLAILVLHRLQSVVEIVHGFHDR